MKSILFVLLTLLFFVPAKGQEIDRLIVSIQEADEPPTVKGRRPLYSIEYKRDKAGNLIAEKYFIDRKEKFLKVRSVVEIGRIEKFEDWQRSNKKQFALSDLNLNYKELKAKYENRSNQSLSLGYPNEIIIGVDSFSFCQPHNMIQSISIGGYTVSVMLLDKVGTSESISFRSDDAGRNIFNLREYLLMYQLLQGIVPEQIPNANYFSQEKLENIVIHYLKVTECEGFHYKEFSSQHPERTPQERRMMKDWSFVDYINKKRNK
jgi:hypothetical protein